MDRTYDAESANKELDRFHYTPPILILYFLLAFIITWSILIPVFTAVPEEFHLLGIIPAAFGPFIAAMVSVRLGNGKGSLRPWFRRRFTFRVPVILYLSGAFFLPVLGIGVLHYLLYRLLGGKPDFSEALPWYLYLLYLVPTVLLTGGNEEPGWRGFALPGLLHYFHPVTASVILGFFHALWHLPMMGHYGTSLGWYLLNVLPLTFLLNWFFLTSRGSIFPVMLLHAGTNVIGSFIPIPEDIFSGFDTFMILRSIVYWIMAIVLLIATKGRLGYQAAAPPVDTPDS
ncbi:MAG: CPBP family intramembrane metalloprotease [Spirochaetales bacterium]|nr:CPBP family intramembrane metalloprotease [Spirochaetales bacterium]